MNMKRIDLVCKLVSPLVFAGLLAQLQSASSSSSPSGECSLLIAIWSMFSFCSELFLVRQIWFRSPVLWQPRTLMARFRHGDTTALLDGRDLSSRDHKRKWSKDHRGHGAGYVTQGQGVHTNDSDEGQALFPTARSSRGQRRWRHTTGGSISVVWKRIESFQVYSHHIVFLASLSYAIIYINLMSVSGTMIGYLQWRGFSASSIAFLKGICTGAELVGTVLMPIATRYVGLVRAGAWSIWLEVATLTPVLLSIYSDRLPIQVFIFAGMALSRVGVWSFDLVTTQIMQEYIEPTKDRDLDDNMTRISNAATTTTTTTTTRTAIHTDNLSNDDGDNNSSNDSNAGLINGWHYSMMNVFELGQFILTMIWSDPQEYYIPCTLSFVCVVVGAVVYSMHVIRMRGHLFHYQRIASGPSSSYMATSTGVSSCSPTAAADEGGVRDDTMPGPSRRVNSQRSIHEEDTHALVA